MIKDDISTQTFGDHDVITPTNTLRKAISIDAAADDDDPVGRAEDELKKLSSEFGLWMLAECERLARARAAVKRLGFSVRTTDALFRAAHDIKGEAATFGFPAVAGAAGSLCRLIEYAPDAAQIPLTLVDQHVDTVRAIYREYARSDALALAKTLTHRLREVTDEFLIDVNQDRPDILALVKSPPLAPEYS
jgi:HPt (histidine-containing phosphotransfer) domain-containing protein